MKYKVGIVGQGFVGSAIYEGLKNHHAVNTFDIVREKSTCKTLQTLVKRSRIIFVCLPTPMKKDGTCDISIVEGCLEKLQSLSEKSKSTKIIVIKSTVTPGTTDELNKRFKNLDLVFSPEFLTEANSFDDFKNQTRIILGGSNTAVANVKLMFRKVFPEIPIVKTDAKTAEMVKYFTNCFLATKVIFANQMYEICKNADINYERVVKSALLDTRIGQSHLMVPGPDGDRGFGGHCFPKDLNAMIAYANKHLVDSSFLSSVWEKNNSIRKNRDWESMLGRAVTE